MLLPGFGQIDLEKIELKGYREVLRAWRAQRGARPFPLKEKIDPFVVPSLAAHLILYEVAGNDFVFRVVGERVVTTVGMALKGKTLFEALGDTTYTQMVARQLRECAATGIPLYSRHDFELPGESLSPLTRQAWRIALPYGDEARVTRLLCYQLFSETIGAPREFDPEVLLPKTVFKIHV